MTSVRMTQSGRNRNIRPVIVLRLVARFNTPAEELRCPNPGTLGQSWLSCFGDRVRPQGPIRSPDGVRHEIGRALMRLGHHMLLRFRHAESIRFMA